MDHPVFRNPLENCPHLHLRVGISCSASKSSISDLKLSHLMQDTQGGGGTALQSELILSLLRRKLAWRGAWGGLGAEEPEDGLLVQ